MGRSRLSQQVELQKEVTEIQAKKALENESHKTQEDKIKEWDKFTTKHTKEEVDELIEKMHQSYFTVLFDKVKGNQFMQTWFLTGFGYGDILSFMLIGMAFFKLRIFHGDRSNRFYLIMLLLGYIIGLPINYYETKMLLGDNFHALTILKADQTYQIGRFFTTMGHVGLLMLFIKSGSLRFLQKSLAAVGKLALTNYLMHSIVTSIIFMVTAFRCIGMLQRYELYYIVAGLWIFQLIYSPIYLKYFLYGPAEWIWRNLTYGKNNDFFCERLH
jgi:uncharacterized protein